MKRTLLFLIYFSPISLLAQWTYTTPADPNNSSIYRLNGNVGIGTSTAPLAKFLLRTSTALQGFVIANCDNVGAQTPFGFTTADQPRIGLAPESYLNIYNQGKWIINSGNTSGTTLPFVITMDHSEKLRINANGNVGIGTLSPTTKLDVNGSVYVNSEIEASSCITTHGDIEIGRGDEQDAKLLFHNYHAGWYSVGRDVSDSKFKINSGGTLGETTHFTMDWLGNIGIGTNTTGSSKLAVEGKIAAREINVLATGWPDYVFEKDHTLPTLAELEAYIKVNKHLPEVPSACAVEENGVNLGEMNAILLKKVEELTLYVIEQQKVNKQQNDKIGQLEKMINKKND